MEKIVSFCKRRGFVFPSSEIYGGTGAVYDFGPLGVELKNNIKKLWWQDIVLRRAEVVGLDSGIIMARKVWQASGHEQGFYDLMVDCKSCKKRFKVDEIKGPKCPECGGGLTKPRQFNMMLKTYMGASEDAANQTYLRPETAQGIFVSYKTVMEAMRLKIPFGIAQIGKVFRNEITPRNFIFRTREFEQMELEYFVKPQEAEKYYKIWVKERLNWYKKLGLKPKNLRLRAHQKKELAHYAVATTDIEYQFPFSTGGGSASGGGWAELEGVANRGNFDLFQHEKASKKDLKYFDETTLQKYLPFVIEPSGGVDRTFLALICDAYEEIKGGRTSTTQAIKEEEVVLRLSPALAPIKVAVFPLVNKENLPVIAKDIYNELIEYYTCWYDEAGSIGRRYRRQDEIGTPFCVTVDFQTLKDKTVTVRDRDTMKQKRVKIKELTCYLMDKVC